MASGNTVIGVEWAVKLDSFKKQMEQVPGITAKEVKAMTAQLTKEMRAAEAASKKAAAESKAAWKDAAEGLDATADSASQAELSVDDAGKAAVKLRGILGSISPEAAGMAGAVDDAADAFEALEIVAGAVGVSTVAATAAFAVLAVVLAAGAAAWVAYNDESARAAEVAGLVATATEKLAPLLDATREAQLDAAVATGEMTEAAARLEREGIASMRAFADATADASAQIKALHAGEGTFARWGADLVEAAQGSTILQVTSLGLVNTLAAMTESSSEAQTKIDALMQVEVEAAAVVKQGTMARKASAAATARHAAKTVDLTAALLKEAAAAQSASEKFAARLATVENAAVDADAMIVASGQWRLTELQKLAQAESAAIDAYAAKAKAGGQLAEEAARGELEIRANYQAQITQVTMEEVAKRAAIEAQAKKAQVESWEGVAGAVIQATDTMSDAFAKSYDTSTVEGRKAAKAQWKTQHGIAIATTAALAVVSGMQAAASAPWPANLPAMIASSIQSTASIIAVAAIQPSFHQGGMAPDEVSVGRTKMQPGEGVGVVSKQGMSAFRGANAGISPGPTSVSVNMMLRHSTVDTVTAQNIQRGGQTARAIAKNGSSVPFGHRKDTWRR